MHPRWLNRGVAGIGVASFFSDVSHEVPTALLPALLTSDARRPRGSAGHDRGHCRRDLRRGEARRRIVGRRPGAPPCDGDGWLHRDGGPERADRCGNLGVAGRCPTLRRVALQGLTYAVEERAPDRPGRAGGVRTRLRLRTGDGQRGRDRRPAAGACASRARRRASCDLALGRAGTTRGGSRVRRDQGRPAAREA